MQMSQGVGLEIHIVEHTFWSSVYSMLTIPFTLCIFNSIETSVACMQMSQGVEVHFRTHIIILITHSHIQLYHQHLSINQLTQSPSLVQPPSWTAALPSVFHQLLSHGLETLHKSQTQDL